MASLDDSNFLYRLPFPEGLSVNIVKPSGTFAHENFPETKYAIDFLLSLGTPVLASRSGMVVATNYASTRVIDPNELVGLSIREIKHLAMVETNFVIIEHDNGLYSEYLHLSSEQIVTLGQTVDQSAVIGYTGRSGIMDVDHLHFNVCLIEEGDLVKSVNVEFYKNL